MGFFHHEQHEETRGEERASGKRVMRDVVRAHGGNAHAPKESPQPPPPPPHSHAHKPPEEPRLPEKKPTAHTVAVPPRVRFSHRRHRARLGGLSFRGRLSRPKAYIAAASTLILFLFMVHVFSSVEVRITPKQVMRQVSTTLRAGNGDGYAVPAEIMQVSLTVADSIPTTGQRTVQERARGTIVVYNAFSSESQPLVRRTRFKTADGKIFRIERPVTVPGVRVENGEVIPGSVEVEVVADGTGPDYNIGLQDFTVPGFLGTPRYEKFYARSKTPMSGGRDGVAQVATSADVARLRSALEERLRADLLAKTDAQMPDGFLRFPEGEEIVMTITQMQPETDGVGETLSMELKGDLSAFIMRKDGVTRALASEVALNDGLEKDVANLDMLRIQVQTRNFGKKELVFTVEGNAHFVWRTADDAQLKRELVVAGGAYETVFKKYPAVTRAEIDFSPSWWRFFPGDADDIRIERVLDYAGSE